MNKSCRDEKQQMLEGNHAALSRVMTSSGRLIQQVAICQPEEETHLRGHEALIPFEISIRAVISKNTLRTGKE